jgi:hypothetical protein
VGETKTGNVWSVPPDAGAGGGPSGSLSRRRGRLRTRAPLRRAIERAGITKRVTVHGLRRTFNNLSRQVAGAIVTRAITGHVTEEMTEHYSHVDRAEKLRAAIRLSPSPVSAPHPRTSFAVTTRLTHPQLRDQVGDSTE